MKHTPGPWAVEGEFDASVRVDICAGTRLLPIAEVEAEEDDWTEEDIGNARLIAAAPEMYAALKSARDGLSCDGQARYLGKIDAAIAKAEGK